MFAATGRKTVHVSFQVQFLEGCRNANPWPLSLLLRVLPLSYAYTPRIYTYSTLYSVFVGLVHIRHARCQYCYKSTRKQMFAI